MPERPRVPHVIIADDKLEMAEMVADGLSDEGFHAVAVASGQEALDRIAADPVDALVTDLRMPGMGGIELLTAARRVVPGLPVIVMTGHGALETAIESIRRGAYHYLTKPFSLEELVVILRRALGKGRARGGVRSSVRDKAATTSIVACSAAMRRVLDVLSRVARIDAPVLLTGPTGTGKGLLARYLHAESKRARGPFVTIDCAMLPEPLLESELFGRPNGASAGSPAPPADLFAKARGGTLFIDEIGEMTPALQAKLLEVLDRGVILPLGSAEEASRNVRIVTATHRDLRRLVAAGLFREDLLDRLDVAHVLVPPLRDRREDIPALAVRFFVEARQRHPFSRVERLSRACMLEMIAYPWPGNVRELAHAIERLVLLGRSKEAQFSDALSPQPHSKEACS